ncbi:MAG: MFS transporter [Burkholderiaceae bacterium]|nr:MAG: MFS transporter [Burkholderiaceae bacterium]TAM11696.1 MAG: MFS transporter [Pusillimonas sp.]
MSSSQQDNTSVSSSPASAPATSSIVALVLALVLVACNLRPALLSLGPVLDSVQDSLHLNASASGFLIMLPILCFSAFAPLVPSLLRRWPAEQLILLCLIILAFGIGLRSLFGITGMFAGTLFIGASISIVMVLLPSIIKHRFPTQAGMMMGVYSTALCLGAAIAAGSTVPIQGIPGSNWQWALAVWLVPALIAAAVWRPYVPSGQDRQIRARTSPPRLRANRLAWQVTLFMGTQSAVAYCVFGWLPLILIDRGMTRVAAGLALSVVMVLQIVGSLAGPWFATHGKDQRASIAVLLAGMLVGVLGAIYAPLNQIWLWTTILGIGMGGTFSVALALLVLRSPNSQVAAALSGMAQGVGYVVSATGPFVVGLLHQLTGNWHAVAVFISVMLVISWYFGMGAGRSVYIEVEARPAS